MKLVDEDSSEVIDTVKKTVTKNPSNKKRRKKKTEIENLKIDDWKGPTEPRRSRPSSNSGQLLTSTTQIKTNPMMKLVDVGYVSSAVGYYCAGPEVEGHGGVGGDDLHEVANDGYAIVDWERTLSGFTVGTDLDEIEPIFLM